MNCCLSKDDKMIYDIANFLTGRKKVDERFYTDIGELINYIKEFEEVYKNNRGNFSFEYINIHNNMRGNFLFGGEIDGFSRGNLSPNQIAKFVEERFCFKNPGNHLRSTGHSSVYEGNSDLRFFINIEKRRTSVGRRNKGRMMSISRLYFLVQKE